jgi:hypothetical protein
LLRDAGDGLPARIVFAVVAFIAIMINFGLRTIPNIAVIAMVNFSAIPLRSSAGGGIVEKSCYDTGPLTSVAVFENESSYEVSRNQLLGIAGTGSSTMGNSSGREIIDELQNETIVLVDLTRNIGREVFKTL